MLKRFLFIQSFLLIFTNFLHAQVLGWQSYTSIGRISDIAIGAGSVWGGSNGGGLIQFNLTDESLAKLSNTDGLSSNEVVAVEVDKHGTIWLAFFDGSLNRYEPATGTFETVVDYKNQTITDIVTFGDSLYIGLDIGVSLYTIDRREVKETYVNLGLSAGENVEKIAANSVTIDGLDIWVCTERGIARSSLELLNLQAPSSWNQYKTTQGLPSNNVNKLVVLDGVPYAATTNGVARLIGQQWQPIGLNGSNVFSIVVVHENEIFPQNSVVSITGNGVFWLNPSEQWQRLGPGYGDVTAVANDDEGGLWIGREEKGLAIYQGNEQWELLEINGPASNNFKSLSLDSKGRLWCASQGGGIHMLDAGVWTNFSTGNGLSSNDQRVIMADSQNRVWAGSWGGGITIFEEVETGFEIVTIDAADETLAGITVDPNFVLVTDLLEDNFGNIWIVNREAANEQVLPVRLPDGTFFYFLSTLGEIGTRFVKVIEIDQSNRIWLGTQNRGVRVIDYMETLTDKGDDRFDQGLNVANDNLLDNDVTAIAEDRDGIIWIGTERGLNFWQGQVGRQTRIINDVVNVIGVDPVNNKWIGTPKGISVLEEDGRTQTDYTTGNSPLVSDNILSFTFNEETGEVWIGTTSGLSRLQTPFTAPKEDLRQLTGFPNPFLITGFDDDVFTITNLAEDTSVNIYTPSGVRIKTFSLSEIKGAQLTWDGKDDDGNFVASGVYVYMAFTRSALSATGKVAVIRR